MHLTTAVDGQKTKYVLDLISKRTDFFIIIWLVIATDLSGGSLWIRGCPMLLSKMRMVAPSNRANTSYHWKIAQTIL